MSDIELSMSEMSEYNFDTLRAIVSGAANGITLEVPCPSIGSANSNLDIASDFLYALFVGESIAEFCETITFKESNNGSYLSKFRVYFICCLSNVDDFTQKLLWLAPLYDYEADEEQNDQNFALEEALAQFIDKWETWQFHFPSLAESYLANYIAGKDDWGDEDEAYAAHPEWKYDFWRSAYSSIVGYNFYVSPWAWIVPRGVHVPNLLLRFGGFQSEIPMLQLAEKFSIENLYPIIYNSVIAVVYPNQLIHRAQKCGAAIAREQSIFRIINMFLAKDGTLLIINDEKFQYILFQDKIKRVPDSSLHGYLEATTHLLEKLRTIAGVPTQIACSWELIKDDSEFEELCYEVISASAEYDNTTLRRMGKSRSRDGGRDIIAKTTPRAGKPSVTWIIQCKFIRKDKSLARSNFPAIVDTVTEYGAGGFCIMTSGYIDATLYDKLDGIVRRNSIETRTWSGHDLELFLAKHPEIRDRHFRR